MKFIIIGLILALIVLCFINKKENFAMYLKRPFNFYNTGARPLAFYNKPIYRKPYRYPYQYLTNYPKDYLRYL